MESPLDYKQAGHLNFLPSFATSWLGDLGEVTFPFCASVPPCVNEERSIETYKQRHWDNGRRVPSYQIKHTSWAEEKGPGLDGNMDAVAHVRGQELEERR